MPVIYEHIFNTFRGYNIKTYSSTFVLIMYSTHKTYIRSDKQMTALLKENPSLLLFLEHFEIDFCLGEITVNQICLKYNLDQTAFILIGNLYNDFYPNEQDVSAIKDPEILIRFLKNSHNYYKDDKYPEIKGYIGQLKTRQNSENIHLIEQFFNSYFNEVLEHLDYEDEVAFPYFYNLMKNNNEARKDFSAKEYLEHHTDIETKLDDLKNLLLNHIVLDKDLTIRRKFLQSLFEFEKDLRIHSIIEEKILLPVVTQLEGIKKNE